MTDSKTTDPAIWMIWRGGYYYRANLQGYTTEPSAAGRYTRAEADAVCPVETWQMRVMRVPEPELSGAEEIKRLRAVIASCSAAFEMLSPPDFGHMSDDEYASLFNATANMLAKECHQVDGP